jgi:hypothetical protein
MASLRFGSRLPRSRNFHVPHRMLISSHNEFRAPQSNETRLNESCNCRVWPPALIDHHTLSSTLIDHHTLSSTLIDHHTLSSTLIDFERVQNPVNNIQSTLINTLMATFVLVSPMHESWEISCKLSLLNFHQLLFSFDQGFVTCATLRGV